MKNEKPLLTFGVIADCQYWNQDGRYQHKASAEKLAKCIEDFNEQPLDFIVNLGDLIDRDWNSYETVLPILDRAKAPLKHVLGNHDFSVNDGKKKSVPGLLKLKDRYYDFSFPGLRFLVLDTNDISLYANPEGTKDLEHARTLFDSDKSEELAHYNGAIGDAQYAWIEEKIERSKENRETVIVLGHHAAYPYFTHTLWNAEKVVELLGKHSNAVAYFNGHNHKGSYGFKEQTHFLTFKSMLIGEETGYSVVSVFENRLEILGYGKQDHYVLEIVSSFPIAKLP